MFSLNSNPRKFIYNHRCFLHILRYTSEVIKGHNPIFDHKGMQRDTMKLDEDLGPDREDDFQTDDEENQADRDFENSDDDDDDSESDNNNSSPSRNLSNGVAINPQWPQSYR